MSYTLYILLCDQKTYYVGITSDLDRRIREHEAKQSFYTKQFSDIHLAYKESFATLTLARRREKQLKGWSNAKKKALIQNNKHLLLKLSKSTKPVEDLQG